MQLKTTIQRILRKKNMNKPQKIKLQREQRFLSRRAYSAFSAVLSFADDNPDRRIIIRFTGLSKNFP